MARETITKLVDDLDGGMAHETVRFALDGVQYEVDLSSKNAKKLRGELATYIDNGTRITHRVQAQSRSTSRGRGGRADRDQNQAIREWAIAKGFDVAPRGRIKQTIQEEFHRTAGR
jgi:hypothetical protein